MRALQLAIVMGATLAVLAFPAGTAGAHARYDRSEPADGAVLTESPAEVDVFFTQEMRRSGGLPTTVVVNDTGDVVSEETVLDDTDRHHIKVSLPPALPDGRYTVIWHTLSDEDGEEAQGAFHFYVGEGPGGATETPAAAQSPTATALATPTEGVPTQAPSPGSTAAPSGGSDNGIDIGVAIALAIGAGAAGLIGGGVIGSTLRKR
jgi:methionine-rich copper-binding protein CopC